MTKQDNGPVKSDTGTQDVGERKKHKRPYEAPGILSVEPLEAVAAVCEPGGGANFGKDISCVQSQS